MLSRLVLSTLLTASLSPLAASQSALAASLDCSSAMQISSAYSLSDSVVSIVDWRPADGGTIISRGSAFYIGKGFFLTAAHVVVLGRYKESPAKKSLYIYLSSGQLDSSKVEKGRLRRFPVTVVANGDVTVRGDDWALVKAGSDNERLSSIDVEFLDRTLKPLILKNFFSSRASAHPFDFMAAGFAERCSSKNDAVWNLAATTGTYVHADQLGLSKMNQFLIWWHAIIFVAHVDLPIGPGISGGPAFFEEDGRLQVIGIVVSGLRDGQLAIIVPTEKFLTALSRAGIPVAP